MKREYCASTSCNEGDKVKRELALGYLNLAEECFDEAKVNFEFAIQLDEKCADAWWGLMLAKFNIKNEDLLLSEPLQYKNIVFLPECVKALQLASPEQDKIYGQLLEEVIKVNKGDEY